MGVTLQPAEAYQRAAALLGEIITELADTEWDLTNGDDGWSIAQTVAWVVVGDSQINAALDRGRLDEIGEVDASVLGPNLVSTWRGTAVRAIASLKAPDAINETVEHPQGLLSVRNLVGQRVTENLVRAWDIGRITGRDVEIPDELAEWCLEFWALHADAVMEGGVLAESPLEPPDDADASTRLLAFTGRRP